MITTVVLIALMLGILVLFLWVGLLADKVHHLEREAEIADRAIDRITKWRLDQALKEADPAAWKAEADKRIAELKHSLRTGKPTVLP